VRDEGGQGGEVGEVRPKPQCAGQGAGHRITGGLVDVHDRDLRPRLGEAFTDRASDGTRAAGHDNGLTGKAPIEMGHWSSLAWRTRSSFTVIPSPGPPAG
jgi:hypothetical protein